MTTSQEHELAELRAFRDGLQSEITSLRQVGDGMSHAATNMHSAIESLTQRSVQLAAHDAELIQNTRNLIVQISEVVDVQKNTSRSFTAQSDTLERSMQSMDISQRALAPIVEKFTQTANSLELLHGQFVMRMAEYLQQQQGLTENFQTAVQGFQGVSPMIDRLGGTVDVMQAQVGELAARIHQSGITMEQVVNGITMASQQQLQSAGRMDAQSSQLSIAMGSFEQGLVGLVPKLAAMADVADAMRNMHREFLAKMSDLVLQQTDAATGFSGTADQMSAAVVRLDVVAHMVDRLGGAVDLMQAQVGKLTAQIDQSGRTMEQVGAGITSAAQQQQQTSVRMDAQSSQLSTAMGSFEQGLVGLVPKLAAMADVADAMRNMHREFLAKMSELVVNQTDAATGFSGTADQISATVARLEVVARTVEQLGGAVDLMQAQVRDLVTHIDRSGRTMEQVGVGITSAAQQQQQTSGRMDAQASQLSTAMRSFEQGLVGLLPKLATMADVADSMRNMHREFLVKMSELVVQQTDVSSELSGTADRMSNAIVAFGNIDDAVKALRSQIQSLVGTTAQSGMDASQLMRQLEEMARSTRTAADVIRDSVSSQKDVLVQFNGGQQRTGNVIDRLDVAIKMIESMLQQIAVTQNEFRVGFREYVEREKATLNSVLEGYQAEKAKGSLVNRFGSLLGTRRNEDAN